MRYTVAHQQRSPPLEERRHDGRHRPDRDHPRPDRGGGHRRHREEQPQGDRRRRSAERGQGPAKDAAGSGDSRLPEQGLRTHPVGRDPARREQEQEGDRVRRSMRGIAATAGALGLMLSLSACGTHSVSTAADQVALHYSGGPFSSKAYKSYVPASTKKWFGPGDKEYLYPAGQRTYDATGGKKAERDSITSVSADSVEMATKVSITFQLKTDEKSLR